MQEEAKPKAGDDRRILAVKRHAQAHINLVNRLIAGRKTRILKNSNIGSILTLRSIEAHTSVAGRAIYGTKWNEKPCGPGPLRVTKCGDVKA